MRTPPYRSEQLSVGVSTGLLRLSRNRPADHGLELLGCRATRVAQVDLVVFASQSVTSLNGVSVHLGDGLGLVIVRSCVEDLYGDSLVEGGQAYLAEGR